MMQHRRFLQGLAGAALLAAVAAGALCLAALPDGYAADKADAPKAAAGPLDFVPADAVAMISIHVADVWSYPPVKSALEKQKDLPQPLKEFGRSFGVGLDEVDRFTMVEESAREPEHFFFGVTTVKPFNKRVILGAAAPDAQEKTVGERSYYDNPRGPSFFFLDDRTFLYGPSEELESYLKHAAPAKEGPLAPVLKMAAEKHVVVIGVDAAAVAANAPKGPPPEWIKPLLKAQLATLTVDLDGQVKADGRVTFAREADARDGAAGLNGALDMARSEFGRALEEFAKDGDAPKFTALLKDAQAALKDAKAEVKGTTVGATASLKLDPDTTAAALAEGVQVLQKQGKRIEISNDLKQLALGALNYSDAYGKMLPPAVYDKDGKPLLSWRVLVLPFIEQGELYKQFHLDEPWDSDNNKKLIDKMPTQFAPPDSEAFKKHETFLQGFVGKGSVFDEGTKGVKITDISDGTSNTILFVEAAKSVPWTKPEDIPFDEGKLLPKVGGLSKGGFQAVFCDSHVSFLPLTLKEETLRALITRAGGEVIPDLDK